MAHYIHYDNLYKVTIMILNQQKQIQLKGSRVKNPPFCQKIMLFLCKNLAKMSKLWPGTQAPPTLFLI